MRRFVVLYKCSVRAICRQLAPPRHLHRPGRVRLGMAIKVCLLCVGKDLRLLRTRCAVLATTGYEAELAMVTEVELRFASKQYDAIIVSAMMSDAELSRIAMAAKRTPALVLDSLVSPTDLLAKVEHLLETATAQKN